MRVGELVSAARLSHRCLLAILVTLLVGSVAHARGAWTHPSSIQVAHILVTVLGLLSLRGTPTERRTVAVTFGVYAVSAAAIVTVGSISMDSTRTLASVVVLALAISVVMPWGPRVQVAAVVWIAVVVGIGAVTAHNLRFSAFDGAAVVGVLIATVYLAHVLDRQRAALAAERRAVRAHAAALERSEALFRAMFESSSHGMARFTRDGDILAANVAMARMVGEEQSALVGTSLFELVGDLGLTSELFDALSIGRRADVRAEHAVVRSDGHELWTQVSVTCLRSLDESVSFVASFDDLSLRKEVERQLESAKRAAESAAEAKGRFLAIMSHEIRTPLNAVLGYNELLSDTELDDDQRLYVGTVEQSGRHLSHLIDDILDFSKIESGNLELCEAELDLNLVLRKTLRMFEHQAKSKGIELTVDIAADVPTRVVGDAKRVRQIATNLIGNALKFTSTGEVAVRLRRLDGTGGPNIALQVADTGIGIAPEERTHLFESFAQANRSVSSKFGGSGLGLAITKQLAEAMHGGIDVDSELGVGSTFCVSLRLPEAHSKAGAALDAQLRRRPELPLAGLRVLIADDDAVSRLLVARLLVRLGCTCTTVSNGQEVLDELRRDHFAIVLLDLDMPVLDGLGAAQRIRTEFPRDEQPIVIALSGLVATDGEPQLLEAGLDDHLMKPLRSEQVAAALRAALARTPRREPLARIGHARR